jgi:hypothetical protein
MLPTTDRANIAGERARPTIFTGSAIAEKLLRDAFVPKYRRPG